MISTRRVFAQIATILALLILRGSANAQFQYKSSKIEKSRTGERRICTLDYVLSPERTISFPAEASVIPPGEVAADDSTARPARTLPRIKSCLIALPSEAVSWTLH
ncbi:MAG: hypothetical protein ABI579_02490, partial [Candidatus Sumerlaeota bacterium]